ncbi:hypothetical protein U1Q18_030807 [Sarracenia purpurea var. burkii]
MLLFQARSEGTHFGSVRSNSEDVARKAIDIYSRLWLEKYRIKVAKAVGSMHDGRTYAQIRAPKGATATKKNKSEEAIIMATEVDGTWVRRRNIGIV